MNRIFFALFVALTLQPAFGAVSYNPTRYMRDFVSRATNAASARTKLELNPNAVTGDLTVSGNITGGGLIVDSFSSPGYHINDLPTDAVLFDRVLCTNMITPYGTGGWVQWDGTLWKDVQTQIAATTNLPSFLLNCVLARYSGVTTRMIGSRGERWAAYNLSSSTVSSYDDIGALISSTGSITQNASGGTNTLLLSTMANAAGQAELFGHAWMPRAGEISVTHIVFRVNTLSDDTDKYLIRMGFCGSPTLSGNDGALLIYDRANASTWFGAGYRTNNWWTVSRAGSANQTNDTGITVDLAWHEATIIKSSTYDVFRLDGVQLWSNTVGVAGTTVPLWGARNGIVKSAGTTAKTMSVLVCDQYTYLNTSRTFNP